ncbi:MAG TPA: hypothetical protein VF060_18315 [Trebonia sp.]
MTSEQAVQGYLHRFAVGRPDQPQEALAALARAVSDLAAGT